MKIYQEQLSEFLKEPGVGPDALAKESTGQKMLENTIGDPAGITAELNDVSKDASKDSCLIM
jgi:hypothetical protein